MTDCEQLKTNYDAYALGALEGEEREELEAHLARGCAACTAGVDEARAVVAHLAYLAPEAAPPASLRTRVLEAVEEPKRSWIPAWAWVAAAALLLFSVFTVQRVMQTQRELAAKQQQLQQQLEEARRLRAELARLEQMQAILRDPGTRPVALKPAAAGPPTLPAVRAFWNDKAGLILVGQQVPAPDAGRTFQLWVVPKKGNPVSAGIFWPDAGGHVLLVSTPDARLADAAALAITDEPAGGRPQPTAKPLWVGPLT